MSSLRPNCFHLRLQPLMEGKSPGSATPEPTTLTYGQPTKGRRDNTTPAFGGERFRSFLENNRGNPRSDPCNIIRVSRPRRTRSQDNERIGGRRMGFAHSGRGWTCSETVPLASSFVLFHLYSDVEARLPVATAGSAPRSKRLTRIVRLRIMRHWCVCRSP